MNKSNTLDILSNFIDVTPSISNKKKVFDIISKFLETHPTLHYYFHKHFIEKTFSQHDMHIHATEYRNKHFSPSDRKLVKQLKTFFSSYEKEQFGPEVVGGESELTSGSQCCCCCGVCLFTQLVGLCIGSSSRVCQRASQVYGDLCHVCSRDPTDPKCPKFDPNKRGIGEVAQYATSGLGPRGGSRENLCCSQTGGAIRPDPGSHICKCCGGGDPSFGTHSIDYDLCCSNPIDHKTSCPDPANDFKYTCSVPVARPWGKIEGNTYDTYDANTLCDFQYNYLYSTTPKGPYEHVRDFACKQDCIDNEGNQQLCFQVKEPSNEIPPKQWNLRKSILGPLAKLRVPPPLGNCLALNSKEEADKCCNDASLQLSLNNPYSCNLQSGTQSGYCNTKLRTCSSPNSTCIINDTCGDIKQYYSCNNAPNMRSHINFFPDINNPTIEQCASFLSKQYPVATFTKYNDSDGYHTSCYIGTVDNFSSDNCVDERDTKLTNTGISTTFIYSDEKCSTPQEPFDLIKCSWDNTNNNGATCLTNNNCTSQTCDKRDGQNICVDSQKTKFGCCVKGGEQSASHCFPPYTKNYIFNDGSCVCAHKDCSIDCIENGINCKPTCDFGILNSSHSKKSTN